MSASGDISNPAFIRIESYSTDDEVKQYAQLLGEKGQMELHQALSKLDRGFIRIGGSLGYPIAVARTRKTETGRVVFLIANRPFEGIALAQGLRSADYPFGVVELKLDGKNKGEGQIIGAAQISISNDGYVEIKSLGTRRCAFSPLPSGSSARARTAAVHRSTVRHQRKKGGGEPWGARRGVRGTDLRRIDLPDPAPSPVRWRHAA